MLGLVAMSVLAVLVDLDIGCPAWAMWGWCEPHHPQSETMLVACPLACVRHAKASAEIPKEVDPDDVNSCQPHNLCIDEHDSCKDWRKMGICETKRNFMMTSCPV
jgi:hypothetical protein